MTDAQHGFRDNKSTETASQIFIENISESVDKQLYVLGLFFYVTKVYDVINHEILLNKLEYYGIRGTLKAWIKSYLLYRSQFVEIFNTDNIRRSQKMYESAFKEIKHGVPQGSVSRPLLFLLYINDLPLNIQDAQLVLFADYINMLIIEKNMDSVQARLNRVIKQFETCLSNNSLIVSTDKTKAVLFHLNKTFFFLSNGRYIDYLSFTYATSKVKNIKSYTINTTLKKRENIKNINTLKPFKINTKILMIRSSHEVVTKRKVSIPSFLSWPPFLIH